jgi:hypothetical protein
VILEAFLVGGLGCAALVPVAVVLRGAPGMARTGVLATVGLWLGLTAAIVAAQFLRPQQPVDRERAVTNRPRQLPRGDYVGSAACQSCHPENHASWYDSYHRTMTQVATEQSVIGDFDNVRLSGKDISVRLFRKDKQFLAEMTLGDPPRTDVFPVVMTTGSHNRQAYWLATSEHSRELLILPYMYLRAEKKWIPRHSGYINPTCLEERPELAILKRDSGRWGHGCIRCHTTQGLCDPANDDVDGPGRPDWGTQAAEFGISCEACHGPGAEHVRANRNPLRRYEQRLAGGPDPTIVNPARLPHDRSSEVCGQCHSVHGYRSAQAYEQWVHHGMTYRPGEDLAADPLEFIARGRPELMAADRPADGRDAIQPGAFWSDGMIRASGRDFNGLLDSPCYQRGDMSCLSCHQMHQPAGDPRRREDWANNQLKLGMGGNSACVQCHDRFNDVERLTRHTHHAADSGGSNCYNCHMPYVTYGILKAIRSHQIQSPNVAKSVETGRPNGCNQCHQDKTLAWTADNLARWYGVPKPTLSADEQQVAATVLWALRGDAGQRALMAWSYGWDAGRAAAGSHWQAPYLAQLLEDRYDAVRIIADRSLRRSPAFRDVAYDPVGPPEQRAAAHRRVLQIWASGQDPPKHPFAREVLIDEGGHVREAEFRRLWGQRDDRPMSVRE